MCSDRQRGRRWRIGRSQPPAQDVPVSDRAVRVFVELVRSQRAWPTDPEAALVAAASQVSGRAVLVSEDDLPTKAQACLVERRTGYEIVLNRHAPAHRRLFSVAHEIGHLVLEPGVIGTSVAPSDLIELMLDTRASGGRRTEAVAEFFAGRVLAHLGR